MCVIVTEPNPVIFIHVPKTAGASIAEWMGRGEKVRCHNPEGHTRISRVRDEFVDAEFFGRAFKFGVVRNPWDRLVSLYFFVNKPDLDRRPEWYRLPFDEVLKILSDNYYDLFTMRQSWFFLDEDGKNLMDYVALYENLPDSLNPVAELLGLDIGEFCKIRRNTSNHDHYSTYYTEETRNLVAEKCAWEIKTFGYKFESL